MINRHGPILWGSGTRIHGVPNSWRGRVAVAIVFVLLIFILLLFRLYYLQIQRGEEFTQRGERNFVQQVRVYHDRGIIYDRHGVILADNSATLDVQVTPRFLGKESVLLNTLERLAGILGMTEHALTALSQRIEKKRGLDRFVPITIQRDLNRIQVEAIENDKSIFLLDGVNVVQGRRRNYPKGNLAAHLLGYVSEISPGQLRSSKNKGNSLRYHRGDLVGRFGVEKRWESILRGRDGWQKIVVDAKGRRMGRSLLDDLAASDVRADPIPGKNVYLTIDAELQQAATDAFDGQAGAVVAIDPRDGSILAMLSVPGFDPNKISAALDHAQKKALDNDPLKPWVNRAIQGQYAPGSTFKVVTGLAALRANMSPKEKINCPGWFRLGNHKWRCHRDAGHGLVDLKQALKVSCDTYFYTLAHRIGIDAVAAAGRTLGIGKRTGFPLAGEQPGLMPDIAFHDRVDKRTGGYQKGMAINTAIGQGSVLMTPLQLAYTYVPLANGGTLYKPQLLGHIDDVDQRLVVQEKIHGEILVSSLGLAPQVLTPFNPVAHTLADGDTESKIHLAALQLGLRAVAEERGGTAYWRRSRLVSMAGKTGTSQVIRLGKDRLKSEEIPYEERDHAWFVGYAPNSRKNIIKHTKSSDNLNNNNISPEAEIVVAVVNEHSGHGGSQAEPIAVKVIDAYIRLRQQRHPNLPPLTPAVKYIPRPPKPEPSSMTISDAIIVEATTPKP